MSAPVVVVSPEELADIVERAVRTAMRDVSPANGPQLVTIAEAAKRLDVNPRTVRRRIAAGELPVIHVGRSVRIDIRALMPEPDRVARLAVATIAETRQ